jgi:hypothetical protein
MIKAWKTYHSMDINSKEVRDTIRSKLSTETRVHYQVLLTPTPERAEDQEEDELMDVN